MGILESFLGSLLWFLFGAGAYRYIYIPIRKNRSALNLFLPFEVGRDAPVSVVYGQIPPNNMFPHFTVEDGDVAALSLLDRTLTGVYGEKRTRIFSDGAASGHVSEYKNILCLSGPRWNTVTAHMMGLLGSPFVFDLSQRAVKHVPNTGPEKLFQSEYGGVGERLEVCYGFIIMGQTQAAGGMLQNVVLCCGINSLSTFGAAVFLSGLGNIKGNDETQPLIRRMRNGKKCEKLAVLLKVSRSTAEVEQGKNTPLDPGKISVEVVKALGPSSFKRPYRYVHQ